MSWLSKKAIAWLASSTTAMVGGLARVAVERACSPPTSHACVKACGRRGLSNLTVLGLSVQEATEEEQKKFHEDNGGDRAVELSSVQVQTLRKIKRAPLPKKKLAYGAWGYYVRGAWCRLLPLAVPLARDECFPADADACPLSPDGAA